MPLSGILSEVTQARVRSLLYERNPRVLDSGMADAFDDLVRGAAVEVVLLTGENPPAGRVRSLAVEAISLQTASEIEYATYPEQQAAGDLGRGYHLHQRYRELLALLRAIIDGNGGQVPDDDTPPVPRTGIPRGRFPEPVEYPDPARVYGRRF